MESRVKVLGHAVHPMLIPFPIAMFSTALVFDVAHLSSGNPRWADIAFWMITAGIIGGLLAAPFGAIDWFAIPRNTRAKRIGLMHGVGNLIIVTLFAASWWLRYGSLEVPTAATVLAFIGVALALVTVWLGGELVDRLGVSVHDGANLDAPSSFPSSGSDARPMHFPRRGDPLPPHPR
jgi:uncharacterized membrane protein